jgi:hypothetical protein
MVVESCTSRLDLSLVGLAQWPGPKRVSFFEGQHGKTMCSVLLVGVNGLIGVKRLLAHAGTATWAGRSKLLLG